MGSPLASIVIRCYNEADHIVKLLHGLSEQELDDFEIVLVDSGSTDGTLEIAEEFGVDKITHIAPENFSFGRALNRGCSASEGDFCVIASAHVYPKRTDWLDCLLEMFDENGDVALVYGKQRGNEVTTFSENQIFKQWFPDHDIERQDHPFCNNANAAIRREIWEDYPYNERLTGLEDVDWAKRVQEAGYEVAYSADAEIIHVHDETAKQIFNRYRREAYAHKQIMPDLRFSFFDFLRLSTKNILADYRAAIASRDFASHLFEIPKFRFLQFLGTYRGFAREGPISRKLYQRFYYPDRDNYPPSESIDDTEMEDSGASDVTEIEYPEDDEQLYLSSDD